MHVDTVLGFFVVSPKENEPEHDAASRYATSRVKIIICTFRSKSEDFARAPTSKSPSTLGTQTHVQLTEDYAIKSERSQERRFVGSWKLPKVPKQGVPPTISTKDRRS